MGAAFFGAVVGDGLFLAEAGGGELVCGDAEGNEGGEDALGAIGGEGLVVIGFAGIVGVALDADFEVGGGLEHGGDFGEGGFGLGFDVPLVCIEVDVEGDEALFLDLVLEFVGEDDLGHGLAFDDVEVVALGGGGVDAGDELDPEFLVLLDHLEGGFASVVGDGFTGVGENPFAFDKWSNRM